MADRLESSGEAPQTQAHNVVRLWYEQNTIGERSKAVTPKVIPSGTGSITSKDGSDCVIETDSHVITPQAEASVMLNKSAMDRLHIATAGAPVSVSLDLDTTTKIRPFAQLPDGKIVEVAVVANKQKFDHATLKFDISNGDVACNPAPKFAAKRLVVGEIFTELGFGHEKKLSAHTLVLTGEKTVGEIKKILSSQHIDVDEVIKKWDENMSVLIFDGEANSGDSGGPVLNSDGVRIGRTLASGAVTIDGETKHITYAAPTDLKTAQEARDDSIFLQPRD